MTKVKEIIFRKGMKQLQIAKDIGIDSSKLSKFVNGWVPLPKKYHKRLAKYLGIRVEEIQKNYEDTLT